MASRRVCILTPGHLSTNPRLVKEADALAEAGFDVSVVAADFIPWAQDADRSFPHKEWRVVRTLPFGPHAPLSSRIVQVLRQRLAGLAVAAGIRNPSVLKAACHPIGPDLVKAALDVRADLYIAHYPAALPAAAIAAQRHRALYAFDAEDFHLGDTRDGPEYNAQRRMLRMIEGRYLPACAYVTAASPGIADAYARAYDIARPTVVLNVFPRAQAPCCPTLRGTAAPGPSVYWFSQTIGPDRGLECAVRAIGQAQSRPHLYLRGTPAAGFLDRLRKIAGEADALDRLHVLPPAAPSEMVRLAAVYDVGLVGETGHTPNRRIALTNKQFTYLLAGIPVVMSNVPAHRDIARAMGDAARLYPVDNPAGLAVALDTLLGYPASRASARNAAWQLGQERFNWDVEQTKLLSCVEVALEARLHARDELQRACLLTPGHPSTNPRLVKEADALANAASKPTLRDIGIYLKRLAPFLESSARWAYLKLPRAWHDTPTSWLQSYFGSETNLCFVQIGAFNGVTGDPIRPLILTHPAWQGALIEPQTSAFAQLRDNYADVACDLRFFNCAISDKRGQFEMYEIDESEIARLMLPPWAREISSFSEAHVTRHFPNVRTVKRAVPVMRLRDVVEECSFTRVDLIVMDVEGHEHPILDDIEFDALGVRVLVFEHKHMAEDEYEAALDQLKGHRFRIRSYGRDTVAYR